MIPRHSRNRGFSLIEVVIAIGVVAYVIFGVMGLLPAGMRTFSNANQQSAAANLLNSLSESIRSANTVDGTNYVWMFNGQSCGYAIGGPQVTNRWNALTLQGEGAANSIDARLCAVVVVTPPASLYSEGSAVLGVAWPPSANPVWNGSTLQWSRVEGSSTMPIRFLPRLPRP